MKIGIAGAGLLGRLAAWLLAHAGHAVQVFDPAPDPEPRFDGQGAAGFTAAGMLSPLAELESSDPELAALGWHSIERWGHIVARLAKWSPAAGKPPHFDCNGSLLLAHGPDLGAARRVLARIEAGASGWPQQPLALDAARLRELEPALQSGALHAWLLPGEAAICTIRTLKALQATAPGVQWHWGQAVRALGPGRLELAAGWQTFDHVFDLRGVGARPDLPVRGVRGETVWLHAPDVTLHRPLRLLHARHRLYLVPRPGQQIVLGASEIESEDRSPVSLRSAVELMAAAHSLIPALAEGRILRLDRNLRPALPDNRPCIHHEPGLTRINGLYRHGWLLAPALLDQALSDTGLMT
ncbi:glycine oxidase [Inhella inkyongensis]|uniref:Glycine oxidase n=1 Tax=Inhella inkyongensis TaxID=392593 RepID=A0A840S2G6_9BURK|nr:FAD-dependent oxidoreductase [Inhella inkyongensis]MBB5202881.1 glycine oxidase [Inhella inkyongensis]